MTQKKEPQTVNAANYITELSRDPLLQQILAGQAPHQLKKSENLTFFLYATIVKQQLSTKVGDVFLKRFLNLYDNREPSSDEVAATPIESLLALGLSKSKASYIQNVAHFDLERGLDPAKLQKMADQEVIDYITSIKGIGRWTAHLFLMSALGREDVFPADDLILQKAVAALYKLDRADKKKFMEELNRISAQWSPFRTFASIHLWRWNGESAEQKS